MEEITEEQWNCYIKIQEEGKTNMMDSKKVEELSNGLITSKILLCIISNYDNLTIKFTKKVDDEENKN
jgi:hypothetical protein